MVLGAFLAAALLLLAGTPADSGEVVIASVPAGECTLSLAAAENWPALRLRAAHPGYRPCRIDKDDVIRTLSLGFSQPHPELASRVFTSLSIGRLIDYPWLSQFLARRAAQDPQWNAAAGTPRRSHVNRYVADILSRPEVVPEIEAAMREHGYRIAGVSVEKVLVGGFENVPGLEGPRRRGKVPFDAQVWFQLKRF